MMNIKSTTTTSFLRFQEMTDSLKRTTTLLTVSLLALTLALVATPDAYAKKKKDKDKETLALVAAPDADADADAKKKKKKKNKKDKEEEWTEWAALGEGYLGRKKKPKKPKKNETPEAVASSSALEINNPIALWLYTGDEGLYGISVRDIASQLGKRKKDIREDARKGDLVVTNEDQSVSWYFDSTNDMVVFAGETYDTFYTGNNAYHLSRVEGEKINKDALAMSETKRSPTKSFGSENSFEDELFFEEEPDFQYRW
jgi:hypothetical protein